MTPSVSKLEFRLSGQDVGNAEFGSGMRLFFDRISSSMTNLRSLSITLTAINKISPRFILLLSRTLDHLKRLEHVILPPRAIVGQVITSIACHTHLIDILPAYRGLFWESHSTSYSSMFSPQLSQSCFPALETLSFCSTPRSAKAFLENPYFPASRILRIHVQVLAQRQRHSEVEPVGYLLKAICDNCTSIMDVSISKTSSSNEEIVALSFATMRALINCGSLTTLTIQLRGCLLWTAVDFDEFAASLPSATTLMLNEAPLPPLQPATIMEDALSPFSRHCSQLRKLGIFFNAREQPIVAVSSPIAAFRFKSLVALHVGTSPISNTSQNIVYIAAFLLAILPDACKIVVGGKGSEGHPPPESDADTDTDSDGESSDVFSDTPLQHIPAWQKVQELRMLCQMEPRLLRRISS
ncbi:hypothetical protein Hypma_000278 [Hypsizygus marmoreus]|uniref:Uncharacterized protein n=1 Tax=Hypsizygus marmoreus TaxID=39966 RepID=A0A369JFI3_HYPMA|nr:hypothetical protein Hypma_000278 [Hypsizygus marmoreus]